MVGTFIFLQIKASKQSAAGKSKAEKGGGGGELQGSNAIHVPESHVPRECCLSPWTMVCRENSLKDETVGCGREGNKLEESCRVMRTLTDPSTCVLEGISSGMVPSDQNSEGPMSPNLPPQWALKTILQRVTRWLRG